MNHMNLARGLTMAFFACLSLSGCQHTVASAGISPLTTAAERSPKLTSKQVADVKLAQGRSLERSGELAQAADVYREVLKLDPSRAEACWRLGVLSDREGNFQMSQEWYRKALAGMPGKADIFCDVGYSYYLQERIEEAEMNLRQAIALDPKLARAHNNLGLALVRVGRGNDALAEFQRSGCTTSECHANLAYGLMLEKDWASAKHHFELALGSDSSSTTAKKGLRELAMLSERSTNDKVVPVNWVESPEQKTEKK